MNVVLALCLGLISQAATSTDDLELKAHLDQLNREVENNARPLPRRVAVLLDMAAALDRAGQAAQTQAAAVAHWQDAVNRIDDFVAKNDDRDKEPLLPLRLQAAVYIWEQGRSWVDRSHNATDVAEFQEAARKCFLDANDRLRKVITDAKELSLIVDNARFRLAQSLSDLSILGVNESMADARRALVDEAIVALTSPFEEPRLAGHAGLLKADLLRRNGRLEEAAKAIEAVEARQPMPSEGERLNVAIAVLNARNQFDQALKRIDGSMLPELDKSILRVRVRLAKHARLGAGAEKSIVETEALHDAEPLQGSHDRLAIQCLIELATAIDVPAHDASPATFELLAEGHLAAKRAVRASELYRRAGDRAKQMDNHALAATERLRSGAILFREAKYVEAAEPLKQVVDDPKAGAARPRASLLRVLAAEKGVALQPPTVTRAAYLAALQAHIKDFPNDPSTSEVRWLLGGELRRAGQLKEGAELWQAIERTAPRWSDARLAIAQAMEDEVIRLLPGSERAAAMNAASDLRKFLEKARAEATTREHAVEFILRLCRLDLLPGVGKPEVARDELDALIKQSASVSQLSVARLYLVVALAESGRVVEAETRARAESRLAGPAEILMAVRLLDRAASESDSDLSRIRDAAILKILLAPLTTGKDGVPEPLREQVRLRQARAHALSGETATARSLVSSLTINPESVDDAMLRDLADLYMRIEAFALVIDVERLRARRLPPGSGAWFEARYGLALAYFRAKKLDEAREIIDATSILHPTLGGGALREKFEKLRRRLAL